VSFGKIAFEPSSGDFSNRLRGARAVTLLFAILGTLAARLVAKIALEDVAHVMDEIAYAFQANSFASGHLSVPPQEPRAAFAMWYVDDRAARYSIFPPGWPAVLAVGVRFHAREWINPLLHGVTTLVVAATGRHIGGERARVACAAVYALSPQLIILAASLMSHTLVALCAAVCGFMAIRASTDHGRPRDFWIAGAFLGLLATTRPLCAVAVALALLVFAAIVAVRRRIRLGEVAGFAIPMIVGCALLGAYNYKITGHATRFPQSVWFDEHLPPYDSPTFFKYHPGCNDLGFGAGHGCDYGIENGAHDLKNAASNTGDNVTALAALAGGGPLVFAAAFFALRRRRTRRILATAIVPLLSAIVLYSLYWYAGTCFGARFYAAGIPGLMLVAGIGAARWSQRPAHITWPLAVLWCATSFIAFGAAFNELRDGYWGNDGRFADLRRRWAGQPALVMVAFADDGVPVHRLKWTGFTSREAVPRWINSIRTLSALAENTPNVDGPIVFAKYHPALVSALGSRFADRAMYVYVVARDRTKDVLLPFEPSSRISEVDRIGALPRDNFDGYVVREDVLR
jgi:hypothetical protein